MSKRPPPAADGASGPREADARSSDVLYPHLAPPAEPDDDEEAAGRTRSIEQLDAETGALIKRWPTIAAAARGLGIHASKVGQVLSRKNRTAGGFRWRDNSREVIEQLDAQTATVVGRWPTRGARGSALLCGGVRWCVVRAGGSGSGGSGLQRGGGGERCGGRRAERGAVVSRDVDIAAEEVSRAGAEAAVGSDGQGAARGSAVRERCVCCWHATDCAERTRECERAKATVRVLRAACLYP